MDNREIWRIKKELRKSLIERRAKLSPEYRKAADEKIFRSLVRLPRYRQARMIFCYVSVGQEVDTGEIIGHALFAGKRVAVPRCIPGRAGLMDACEIHSPAELIPGAFGIPEPPWERPAAAPEELDFCIVPCLSANPDTGVRLGYGGGYYDRYLSRTGAARAVLCREALLDHGLPEEAHDLRMDLLITENQVILYEIPV